MRGWQSLNSAGSSSSVAAKQLTMLSATSPPSRALAGTCDRVMMPKPSASMKLAGPVAVTATAWQFGEAFFA